MDLCILWGFAFLVIHEQQRNEIIKKKFLKKCCGSGVCWNHGHHRLDDLFVNVVLEIVAKVKEGNTTGNNALG